MSETRKKYPLSEKKIIKKTITNSLGILFFMIILLFCSFISLAIAPDPSVILIMAGFLFIIFLLCIVLVYMYQRWYFATYFYDLTDDYVIIRKSPLTPKEITIPYERMQDVYVDQDLLDRLLGLYDVHISTATIMSGMTAHIDGVKSTAANGLRTVLLNKVQEKVVVKSQQK